MGVFFLNKKPAMYVCWFRKLDGDGSPDGLFVFISNQFDVFPSEIQNIFYIRIQSDGRQLVRRAGDLLFYLVNMIQVDMSIAKEVIEETRLAAGYMCHLVPCCTGHPKMCHNFFGTCSDVTYLLR